MKNTRAKRWEESSEPSPPREKGRVREINLLFVEKLFWTFWSKKYLLMASQDSYLRFNQRSLGNKKFKNSSRGEYHF